MIPSPTEARALARLSNLPRMTAVMEAQFARGRVHYGQDIGAWQAERQEALAEAAAELADLLAYFTHAQRVPHPVYHHLRQVAEWLERELTPRPPCREAIVAYLSAEPQPTTEAIYAALPAYNSATVRLLLHKLAEQGVLRRHGSPPRYSLTWPGHRTLGDEP